MDNNLDKNVRDDERSRIKEMAKDICHARTCKNKNNDDSCYKNCNAYIYASRAISVGYRKQSDIVRDIFEDIETLLSLHFCSCLPSGGTEHYNYYEGDLANALADLRKKYEGEQVNE